MAAIICYGNAAILSAEEATFANPASLSLTLPPITSQPISNAALENSHQEKPHDRKFTADSLLGLLLAEFADIRQMNDLSLKYYMQQAIQTRDPQIAARATIIARYVNNKAAALQMSQLWLETAPYSKEALTNASLILIQAGRLLEAFEISERLHRQGDAPLFQNIATRARILTKAQREFLLQRYQNLLTLNEHDEQLLISIGLLLRHQHRFADAMAYANRALSLYPQSISAAMLEVNLLHELKRDREAISKMSALLILYPANTNLRNQYARTLTHHDRELAQQQFTILSEQLPNDADVRLSLGIIAMERKDFKTASQAFERLLDTNQHLSKTHYYLGQIAENQRQWNDAIFNYLQVERGNDFFPANVNLLDIFIRKGDLLSAQQHMTRVRLRYPDEAKNLYLLQAQALVNHNYLREAEAVLNEALELNPNDSVIINSIISTTMKRLKPKSTSTTQLSTP
ncbi:MAG: tetratricopeptide repeat protein [Pseudomonadota bacterium]